MIGRDTPAPVITIDECRHILEIVEGHAAIVDIRGTIQWLNRAPTGTNVEDYIGSLLIEQVVADQRPLVRAAMDKVVAGAPSTSLEVRGALTDRWYALRLHRIRLRDQESPAESSALFVHALDINDAKRARAELAIARARRGTPPAGASVAEVEARRFERMADSLPLLISYVDKDRNYQYNNALYEEWFETSREQLRGRGLEAVLGSAAYAQIRGHVDAVLAGQLVRFEMTIQYKHAGARRVVAHYVPDVTQTGEVVGFHAVIEDITAQRQAETALARREAQLREAQKLEALGRLASGIAHEFGNVLMTIISGCTAASEAIEPNTPLAAIVAPVKRAAQRGSSLTRQLLAFGSDREPSRGHVELDPVVGDIAVLLDRVLGNRIQLEVELGANVEVDADAGQIQQILMNLAINARDAMPEGGKLRIVTTRIDRITPDDPRPLTPGRYAVLSVSDTGTGMDAQTRARVFDPFFTTKAPGEGTGLGLSTVFGIARKIGGHVEVDSTPGEGSTFRVYLPVHEP